MSGDFIDSNVILYLLDPDTRRHTAARSLIDRALAELSGWISFQVVQEVLNVVTRRFAPPATDEQARQLLTDVLLPLWRVSPSPALYQSALDVRARYQFSFYDSLIVAAALTSGCDRLFSEDLQDGQVIDGLRIDNPFSRV